MRFCAKNGCGRDAVATCGFSYADRRVWLSALGHERDPSSYDLCREHAETLRVPKGWELEDLRDPVPDDLFGDPEDLEDPEASLSSGFASG